jgi:isoquinoline 1-oxidoreductase beta subunit
MTALPIIVAEELDADWDTVNIEFSPIEPQIYGNPEWFSGTTMITVGSRTVMGYYSALRKAGAQARAVLLAIAARKWDVPVKSLTTEPSVVVHEPSARRLTYGEIAAFGEVPNRLPSIRDTDLKPISQFRLIGKSVPRVDIPAKVDGSAQYAMDVRLPGMVYAAVTHSPVNGARPRRVNAAAVKARPGIVDVHSLADGVAVVGKTFEAVLAARDQLEIAWSKGARAESFNSEEAFSTYGKAAGNTTPRKLKGTAKTYSGDFRTDHAYHAQMEPLNAVASVNETGDGAEIWAGTQFPQGAVQAAASELGTDTSKIKLHPQFLGGGFGRRSMSDYILDAVRISKRVKRPVKVIWTREDDIAYGAFRPMSLHRFWAGVNKRGDLVSWKHRVVGNGGWSGLLTSSGVNIPFYDIADKDIVTVPREDGVRVQFWRAVGHGFNKFAIESFIDEVAVGEGIDPYEYRRRLMRKSPRALKVLETAAGMAGWGKSPPPGRALGMAFAERSGSLAAGIAEISVDRSSGRIRIHRFWASLDAGVVVQPDNAIAQMESGIVYGLSAALFERVTFEKGVVQQSNFHDYPVMRMADAPEEIHVRLVTSGNPPTGIGEPGVPITGGAVANAFATLTGKRLRHMPFTPERILKALKT